MNRTLGFEKTLQRGQFQPIKVSSFVTEIPDSLWVKEGFIEELGKLLTVQAYKILTNEIILDKELLNAEGTPAENLERLEKSILKNLDLENLLITLNVEITEKK